MRALAEYNLVAEYKNEKSPYRDSRHINKILDEAIKEINNLHLQSSSKY